MGTDQGNMKHQKSKNVVLSWIIGFCVLIIVAEAVALIVVLIIGKKVDPYDMNVHRDQDEETRIQQIMLNAFKPENMGKRVEIISKQIHVAGTDEQKFVTEYLYKTYTGFGFDKVEKHSYDVLLSYPDWSNPNTFKIMNTTTDTWDVLSDGLATRLGPAEAREEMVNNKTTHWWNAYAKAGNATGSLVYANFGTIEDYEYLNKSGISVEGKIVLVRYGNLWRGAKVYEAARRHAAGVLIFSDPSNYGGPAVDMNLTDVFPSTDMLPPSGAQRGSLMNMNGDPLTMFYPSLNYTYRSTTEEDLRKSLVLPDIPVTPIGYGDAQRVLESMDGAPVTEAHWRGDIPTTYKFTGSAMYRLTANVHPAPMTQITDVCATLYGKDEPDRLYGTLYDGAIKLMQWDAEEFGLIGSFEFVEQHLMNIQANVVAYINMDIAVAGNVTFGAEGIPSLFRVLEQSAKAIKNPNAGEVAAKRTTVYDSWKHWQTLSGRGQPNIPLLAFPGSGSDHYGFMAYAGVPIVDITYICAPLNCYTLYHSMYEVPWTVGHLMDRGWHTHVTMGRMSLETARALADTLIIPLNLTDYAVSVQESYQILKGHMIHDNLTCDIADFGFILTGLGDAFARLTAATKVIQIKVDLANSGADVSVRDVQMLNSRLVNFERAFINPRGLYAQRPDTRHVIYANSLSNSYAGEAFPAVRDMVHNFVNADNGEEKERYAAMVRQTVSELQYSIESAILSLNTNYYTETPTLASKSQSH